MTEIAPNRVQYRRNEPLPPNTKYVGRPTPHGNPFRVKVRSREGHRRAVSNYRLWIDHKITVAGREPPSKEQIRAELRGLNLACWCPLDWPCHADVLLEIAND